MSGPVAHDSSIPNNMTGLTWAEKQAALVETESYVTLLLADSGLPTGGFVASAGLEAWACHGGLTPGHGHPMSGFVLENVRTYSVLAEPFVGRAWDICHSTSSTTSADVSSQVHHLIQLDQDLHACTLGHVARRASLAQGGALLTLYAKSFRPATGESPMANLMLKIKAQVRLGTSPGHFPSMWGAFCAAIGISKVRAIELHIFLHARAIVSSAVRLGAANVGPYAAQLLLAGDVRSILAAHTHSKQRPQPATMPTVPRTSATDAEWDWNWSEDCTVGDGEQQGYLTTTWPLLELVQGRHDVLHTRLFNS